MKNIVLVAFFFCSLFSLQAQELQVKVTVNTPKLQTTDPAVFKSLETSMQEFMNNQNWTDDVFEVEERIDVNIQLTIKKELGNNTYEAEMAIQSSRPIYGSSDATIMINHRDEQVNFKYEQFQPLEYVENGFGDNLAAIMAFYSYIILGTDYDSFAPFGGTPHFQTAQDILNNVPPNAAAAFQGWRSLDGNRNRYWIIENILSPRMRPYRQAIYDYHRQSLDIMHKDVGTGRAIMTEAIKSLGDANRSYPNSMILQMFTNAKSDEIIEIFKQAPPQEKSKVIQVMSKVDASNASKYGGIRS